MHFEFFHLFLDNFLLANQQKMAKKTTKTITYRYDRPSSVRRLIKPTSYPAHAHESAHAMNLKIERWSTI